MNGRFGTLKLNNEEVNFYYIYNLVILMCLYFVTDNKVILLLCYIKILCLAHLCFNFDKITRSIILIGEHNNS